MLISHLGNIITIITKSKLWLVKTVERKGEDHTILLVHLSLAHLLLFILWEGTGGRERSDLNSFPHTHSSIIPHLLTPFWSPKYHFFSLQINLKLYCSFLAPSLGSGFSAPAPKSLCQWLKAQLSPSCQSFWTGMISKQLTYKRTFVTQPVLNMETIFIKNQIHLQRMKINHQRY